DALLEIVQSHALQPDDIASVVTHVHQGAIDVLGPVVSPTTVHQSKFSMGTVLGLIATHRRAGLSEFDAGFNDEAIKAFRDRVTMELDAEVDQAYPAQWIGKVTVHTRDGITLDARVDEPKGDPGNTLSREEIENKARRLGTYRNAASADEVQAIIDKVWRMADTPLLGRFID